MTPEEREQQLATARAMAAKGMPGAANIVKQLEARTASENSFQGLQDAAKGASAFGRMGEKGYGQLGAEMAATRARLERQALGQDSISAEQLRQGLQQQQAMQQSMAASARPANAAMAARTAMMQAGRNSSAMAGQQALAGIQERNAANLALGNMQGQARGQDLQAALGGRDQAIQSFGTINGIATQTQAAADARKAEAERQALGAMQAMGTAIVASDRRLKTDIKSGADAADDLVRGLRAHLYRYKDSKYGKGEQLGVMAQELEKTRIGRQAVIDTPSGKMVDGGKLAGALAAATARIGERLSKLEEKAGK